MFKIDGIKSHALSDIHREAIMRKMISGALVKTITNMFDKATSDLKRLMKCFLYLTKERSLGLSFPVFA
jgi:hypothetical protein